MNQLRSNLAVTKKSQAVISRPIVREDWELNNDDIELGEKIDNVSILIYSMEQVEVCR